MRCAGFRSSVIDDLVAFGDFEEFGIGLGGGEPVYGEDLSAAGGAVDLGDEIDSEVGGVPELAGADEGLVVAHDAGVESGGVAVAGHVFAAGVAGSQVLVLAVTLSVGEGTGDAERGLVDRVGTHVEVEQLTDPGPYGAVVPGVLDGVHDLEDLDLRFLGASFGYEEPALLVDASFSVAHDGALVGEGHGSAACEGAGPFGDEGEAEGGAGDGRDGDALHSAGGSSVVDHIDVIVMRRRVLGGKEGGQEDCGEEYRGRRAHEGGSP